jgi:radical SAM family protein
MNRTALLLFPPNWTVCASGPHLALPLLAGMSRGIDWYTRCWDLTTEFAHCHSRFPSRESLIASVVKERYDELDEVYFRWEDEFRIHLTGNSVGSRFGLLSGYQVAEWASLPLADAAMMCERAGTIFSSFYRQVVFPELAKQQPAIIGVTIASGHQIIPAIELIQGARRTLPNAFLVLGGNVVTRLRGTSAFRLLESLVDQLVVFQGDLAFRRIMMTVSEIGPEKARSVLPRNAGDEAIPHDLWAVPTYRGIDFNQCPGIPTLSYASTRGCYWGKCHFCAIPAGWSKEGYGGSAPAEFVAAQLGQMVEATSIPRVKFVDEAMPPRKVGLLAGLLAQRNEVEWEGYARLEPAWEDIGLLTKASRGGLRKLYLGLEQAPTTNRSILNKNDKGDITKIMKGCRDAGIKVHLFCMVGHPGTSRDDARATTDFLLSHQELIDTADLVGFRLDRGTSVPGVRAVPPSECDWATSFEYEPTISGGLWPQEVAQLESECQELLWEHAPRLLHPLYRLVSPWQTNLITGRTGTTDSAARLCSVNCS